MRDFRKLDIWTQSIEFVDKVYDLCENFPKSEIYGISQQIQRSAVSIPSNIAEGCSRMNNKEFSRFLDYSLGSSFELETQLIIAFRRNYFENALILEELNIIQKRINAFRNSLK
jgi:four helix bundle protein